MAIRLVLMYRELLMNKIRSKGCRTSAASWMCHRNLGSCFSLVHSRAETLLLLIVFFDSLQTNAVWRAITHFTYIRATAKHVFR
jgi:hypothetical protein